MTNNIKNSLNKSRNVSGAETTYIFNTDSFLQHGWQVVLVLMGLYLNNNDSNKYSTILSVGSICYWAFGYNLMYRDVNGYIGNPGIWKPEATEFDLSEATYNGGENYSNSSDFFFQVVFSLISTAVFMLNFSKDESITSKALFALGSSILYPITGSWQWGGGWLSEIGFADFAGSSIVFSGAALGSFVYSLTRLNKLSAGQSNARYNPGIIGNLLFTLGFLGFTGGSQLAKGSALDAKYISDIFVNTLLASSASVLGGAITEDYNSLPGLVSIAAEPLEATPGKAVLIGFVSNILFEEARKFSNRNNIADPNNTLGLAISGLFGTLAVGNTNDGANYKTQGLGAFVYLITWAVASYALSSFLKNNSNTSGKIIQNNNRVLTFQ